MRLTFWDSFREIIALQRAINSVFRDFPSQSATSYPPIRLVDKGDGLMVTAEIPGLKKDELEITILRDTLTIAGEKKLPTEEGVNYIRHERPHGRFRRLIGIPYPVDHDKVSASYKDGVLTITLPKTAEAKPKQITVE